MGSSSSKATADAFQLEQLRDHYVTVEGINGKAFKKCVEPPTEPTSTFTLSDKEIRCIREYAAMYGDFQRKATQQFMVSTEQMMRDMQKLQGGR